MIFLDNIYQLQYYQGANAPCYCELLLSLADLTLQAETTEAAKSYKVFAYTVDGLSSLGDISDAFGFATASFRGAVFFQLKALRWPDLLCQNPCFILRVQIADSTGAVIFDKYTERYCLDSCCLSAGAVVVDGVTANPSQPPVGGPGVAEITACRRETHVLEGEFDCYDPFGNQFYGSGFSRKRVVLEATFRQQPREITRQISGNCRVQRTESTRTYELQSFQIFPTWKMEEIENLLHAQRLFFDGAPLQFSGGTPFERIHKRKDWHRLKVILEECKVWQNTSCGDSCDTAAATANRATYYAFPETVGVYRDDAGRVIAYKDADLIAYLQARTGVQSAAVSLIETPDAARVFKVLAEGKLPAYLYHDAPVPANKVFAYLDDAQNPDYYQMLGLPYSHKGCKKPALNEGAFEDVPPCLVPQLTEFSYMESCREPILSNPLYTPSA